MSAPETAAAPAVSAAIATYNGRAHLEVLLPSLDRQTVADRLQIVVVDDCSSDGTVEWLTQSRPDVDIVSHERNLGVTRSLNDCLSASRGEFVALLNSDIELEPDCLERLLEDMQAHPEAAAATGKLLNYYRRDRLDGAGDIYAWSGVGGRRGHGELDRGQHDRPEEVVGACAALALYRRSAIERVGGFDDDFYAYFEDLDWSLRAQLAGYTCRYVPAAVAYHMAGGTLGDAFSPFSRYQLWRNGIWLIAKNLPASLLLRHAPSLLKGQLFHVTVAARERRLGVLARAWRDALRGLPGALRKRRAIQGARRISPETLERRIVPVRALRASASAQGRSWPRRPR